MQQTLSDCELLHNVKLRPSQPHSLTLSHLQGMPGRPSLQVITWKTVPCVSAKISWESASTMQKNYVSGYTIEESWGLDSKDFFTKIIINKSMSLYYHKIRSLYLPLWSFTVIFLYKAI